MNRNSFRQRLQTRFEHAQCEGEALGIDLGTTTSCAAIARYDVDSGELTCESVRVEQDDGKSHIAIPSAVALDQGRVLVGAPALARRGQPGFLPERRFFYETKNTIGLKYTYANARPGFEDATAIAAHVLHHVYESVEHAHGWLPESKLVVGCPASFHAAQREATLAAAGHALDENFPAGEDESLLVSPTQIQLIDEPYAAFLDLLFREPGGSEDLLAPGNTLMVFDFGGGTCDVAIFGIDLAGDDPIGARLLATSRYHRLGGGDLDRAIVHEILIPQLIEENGIGRFDLSWFDKSRRLEPALIGAAEELKVRMSHLLAGQRSGLMARDFEAELAQLELRYEEDGELSDDEYQALQAAILSDQATARALARQGAAGDEDEVVLPALGLEVEIKQIKRTLSLSRPTLSREAFNRILKDFLDPEPAPESGDEYVHRSSIFSPITQALLRAGLEPGDIDGVLMCGCSCLLPPVQAAIRRHFPDASCVLAGQSDEELLACVARGAALQALAREVLDQNLIEPVCSAELSLSVSVGTVPLIKPGDTLPARSSASIALSPPRDDDCEGVDLSVEVMADGKTLVGRTLWHLPAPVRADDPLSLDWVIDENQCIELSLRRTNALFERPLVKRFDSPAAHCDMGQVVRTRMLERMERMRSGNVAREDVARESERIARDAAALGEYERALHFVSVALQEQAHNPVLLNLRGIYRDSMGNTTGAIEAYQQAAQSNSGASFNLGLLHYNAGRHAEALQAVDAALKLDPARAYRVLRGNILEKMGRKDEARQEWQDAIAGNIKLDALDEFDFGWLNACARRMGNQSVCEQIRKIRERLAQGLKQKSSRQGELPVFVGRPVHDVSELL